MSGDLKLGRILGIPFRLHWSWFAAVFLIAWSMSQGFFRETLAAHHQNTAFMWGMGFAAAIGLFISVLLHEMGHAVVARRFGIPVRGIRLFVFGGVAEIGGEPRKPSHEILIALAGPLVTLIIVVVCQLSMSAVILGSGVEWQLEGGALTLQGGSVAAVAASALLFYLGGINLVLLIFNMIPAFPLDGGRVLRGIIWAGSGNFLTATRVAGAIGIVFSYVLFAGGFLLVLRGNLIGGLWFAFLGIFLQNAANASIAYAQLQQLFRGVRVDEVMNSHPATIDANMSIRDAVDHYFLHYPYKAYPVIDDNSKFIGILTLRAVQESSRDEWDMLRAGDVAEHADVPALHPDDSALDALKTLAESGHSRLPVVRGNELVGFLCARDLMDLMENRSGLVASRA